MGMENHQGSYALVQFCPVPERLEFLNIGLVLVVPALNVVRIKFAGSSSRIDRLFGRQSKAYLDAIKRSFEVRLCDELKRSMGGSSFQEFVERRANDIRVTRLMSVRIGDIEADFSRLFDELVGDNGPVVREPRMRRKLREAFVSHQVDQFLDQPDDVELPEYGLKVSVPYGYQNGCYNLIDGMRVPANVNDGLREAGKRSMEGALIWKHFEQANCKRLVVVGDFAKQSNAFYQAVRDQFEGSNVSLYRLDDIRPLLNDILENAVLHGERAH